MDNDPVQWGTWVDFSQCEDSKKTSQGVAATRKFEPGTTLSLSFKDGTTKSLLVPFKQAVAIKLTESCPSFTDGKVFWVPPAGDPCFNEAEIPDAIRKAYHQLPSLVYLPYKWDYEEGNRWRELQPKVRIEKLTATERMLSPGDKVIPIALVIHQMDEAQIRMNALNDNGAHDVKVTLTQGLEHYLGLSSEMAQGAKPGKFEHGRYKEPCLYCDLQHINPKYYQISYRNIVKELNRMSNSGQYAPTVFFGEVSKAINAYREMWAEFEKGTKK
ncbi:MAG: hypothetical protein Q9219_003565 [cf. Caloplaca sp. 3 TL-2023]